MKFNKKELKMKKNNKDQQPILLSMPNTISEKMEAIVNVSKAILEISKALNSVNVNNTISNCVISNCENGIKIDDSIPR